MKYVKLYIEELKIEEMLYELSQLGINDLAGVESRVPAVYDAQRLLQKMRNRGAVSDVHYRACRRAMLHVFLGAQLPKNMSYGEIFYAISCIRQRLLAIKKHELTYLGGILNIVERGIAVRADDWLIRFVGTPAGELARTLLRINYAIEPIDDYMVKNLYEPYVDEVVRKGHESHGGDDE